MVVVVVVVVVDVDVDVDDDIKFLGDENQSNNPLFILCKMDSS